MRRETALAIDVVRESLLAIQSQTGINQVTGKSGRDIVTTTDVLVEDLIRERLVAAFGLPVVGEERGGDVPSDGRYWLVDPICGTRNFASGLPLYSVNLALVEGERAVIGLVGDASRAEVLCAERGAGAWVAGAGHPDRLRVSEDSRTIVVEDGKSTGLIREHAARFMAESVRADQWDFRSLGSTLSLAYLAAGRISAYVVFGDEATATEHRLSAVHSAAGSLLVEEAGGVLATVAGEPWTLSSGSLLFAATEELKSQLLAIAKDTKP